MKKETYEAVYSQLAGLPSIEILGRKHGIPKETLRVLFIQKVIRETKRKHASLQASASKLLARWRAGESFLKIAESIGFPPIMVASLILAEMGMSRRSFRAYLKDPTPCENARIRCELSDALANDIVYSPDASVEQACRGRLAEEKVGAWLSGCGVSYKTEHESRKEGSGKTPDFLLTTPLDVSGRRIRWVESKATFGDGNEMRSDYRKQMRHYVELFGDGAVVYWYGFLEGNAPERILLLSSADIKPKPNK